MNWLEGKDGSIFVRKQVYLKFFQEEVDWVTKHYLGSTFMSESQRGKAIDHMTAAYLKNARMDGTWIIDFVNKKFPRLIWDREAHYFEPERFMIYDGRLFEIVK